MLRFKHAFLLLSAIIFSNCGGKTDTTGEQSSSTNETEISSSKEVASVSIWDNSSVRETPGDNGKYITSMALGEKLVFLGETMVDSTSKREYGKVRLQDGKEGWSRLELIVPNGEAASITSDVVIYKRPDIMTASDKSFYRMDVIGVKSVKDDWLEVVGKPKGATWITTGWIKKENITTQSVDLAVAVYASRALAQKDEAKKIEEIEKIINNNDLSGSVFIDDLSQLLNKGE